MRSGLLLPPFYIRGNESTERVSDLTKVTQFVDDGAGVWTQLANLCYAASPPLALPKPSLRFPKGKDRFLLSIEVEGPPPVPAVPGGRALLSEGPGLAIPRG